MTPEDQNQIELLRTRINNIDMDLQFLIEKRVEMAKEIGEIKKRSEAPIHVPEREADIKRLILSRNGGKLPDDMIVGIFNEVIALCRSQQQ